MTTTYTTVLRVRNRDTLPLPLRSLNAGGKSLKKDAPAVVSSTCALRVRGFRAGLILAGCGGSRWFPEQVGLIWILKDGQAHQNRLIMALQQHNQKFQHLLICKTSLTSTYIGSL